MIGAKPKGGWGEFAIVVAGAFGYFIVPSLFQAFHPQVSHAHTTGSLWGVVAFEVVVAILLGTFLHHRGWSARNLGLRFRWSDIPIGIGLAGTGWLVWYGCYYLAWRFAPGLATAIQNAHIVTPGITVASALCVSLVNPVYEEVFVTGYIVAALKTGKGSGLAINLSVLVRLLYHLYQGVAGVISAITLGLIFATSFERTGRLWPLIVAHALFDAVGLLYYVRW